MSALEIYILRSNFFLKQCRVGWLNQTLAYR